LIREVIVFRGRRSGHLSKRKNKDSIPCLDANPDLLNWS
jgi:hypothetical protein